MAECEGCQEGFDPKLLAYYRYGLLCPTCIEHEEKMERQFKEHEKHEMEMLPPSLQELLKLLRKSCWWIMGLRIGSHHHNRPDLLSITADGCGFWYFEVDNQENPTKFTLWKATTWPVDFKKEFYHLYGTHELTRGQLEDAIQRLPKTPTEAWQSEG